MQNVKLSYFIKESQGYTFIHYLQKISLPESQKPIWIKKINSISSKYQLLDYFDQNMVISFWPEFRSTLGHLPSLHLARPGTHRVLGSTTFQADRGLSG